MHFHFERRKTMKKLVIKAIGIKSFDELERIRENILYQLERGNVLVMDDSYEYEFVEFEAIEVRK
jgi:tyrosine-protein phosphatase YwqE